VNVEELQDAVSELINAPVSAPLHVVRKLELLLGADEPIFIDARGSLDDSTTSGAAVIFTERRVIAGTWDDSPRGATDKTAYTSDAGTWSRSALLGVDIESNADEDTNPDKAWSQDYGELWPYDAYVKFTYKGAPTIALPLSDQPSKVVREGLRGLVHALVAGLA
jgi:hypothetical protein